MGSDYADWRERLAEAVNQDFYPLEYLDWLLANGRAWLMANDKAAIVIEFKSFPSGVLAVHGLCAAGDMEEIKTVLIPAAEQFGRENGCKYGLIESRPGWARVMKEDGYEVFQTSIIKEL